MYHFLICVNGVGVGGRGGGMVRRGTSSNRKYPKRKCKIKILTTLLERLSKNPKLDTSTLYGNDSGIPRAPIQTLVGEVIQPPPFPIRFWTITKTALEINGDVRDVTFGGSRKCVHPPGQFPKGQCY